MRGILIASVWISAISLSARITPLLAQSQEIAIKGNAGVFVGVNSFKFSKAMTLDYAVNDAIAMAHAFVFDLRLIPTMNCWLIIDGEASGPVATAQLKALKDAGVEPTKGSKADVIVGLKQASAVAQLNSDLLVCSISSHGFEEEAVPYVFASDAFPGHLKDTALRVAIFDESFRGSAAGKKILFVDACRESRNTAKAKGEEDSAAALFASAFDKAQGQVTLMSCRARQKSYESEEYKMGVFTHWVIEALKGGFDGDPRGMITMGALSDFVAKEVNKWARRNRPSSADDQLQTPNYSGDILGRDIPFKLSLKGAAIQARRQSGLQNLSASVLAQSSPLSGNYLDEVRKALDTYSGSQLEELLNQLQLLAVDNPTVRENFRRFWTGFAQAVQPLVQRGAMRGAKVKEGEKAALAVDVIGPNFKEFLWEYQRFDQGTWQRLDVPSKSELIINNVKANDSGRYRVTAIAGDQKLTVGPVEITVLSKPRIVSEPSNLSLTEGERGTLSLEATGEALEFWWEFKLAGKGNWKRLEGVTSTYTIPHASMSNAGDYKVTVKNESGTVVSSVVEVTVAERIKPPEFFSQPIDQEITERADVTFTAEAQGSEPLAYEWERLKENESIWRSVGSKSRKLVILAATAADGGRYRAKARNAAGSSVSTSATLTVKPAATQFILFINSSVRHTVDGNNIFADGGSFIGKTLVAIKLPPVFNSSYAWQIQWLPPFGGGFSHVKVNGDIVSLFPNGFGGLLERSVGRISQ